MYVGNNVALINLIIIIDRTLNWAYKTIESQKQLLKKG